MSRWKGQESQTKRQNTRRGFGLAAPCTYRPEHHHTISYPLFCVSQFSSLPLGVPSFSYAALLPPACLAFVGSSRLLLPPPLVRAWCLVLSALATLGCPSVGCFAVPCCRVLCCVSCCGASTCGVLGCCALCRVRCGMCLCVVLCCWLLLRVVPCPWPCCAVGLFAVWIAVWVWSALRCAVLCCAVSLGAVLRRAAARCAARCCAVVCCVALFCSFGAAACCAVPSCAARRPRVLCFSALCFAVFPRTSCSVLCVLCPGVLVRAVVRRCALCCVCPGVSCCVFCVPSALCSAVLRCAGALALCCSCGVCCCRCRVLWCIAVLCAVSFGVVWCADGSGCSWLSSGGVFRCRCPCLAAWPASLWLVLFAVVACVPVLCSVVMCCRVVLCSHALLSSCGAVCACFFSSPFKTAAKPVKIFPLLFSI